MPTRERVRNTSRASDIKVVREGRARMTAPVNRFNSGRRLRMRKGRRTLRTPKTVRGPCIDDDEVEVEVEVEEEDEEGREDELEVAGEKQVPYKANHPATRTRKSKTHQGSRK